MAKPSTIKIRLNSTADTGHFYVTKKNSRTMTDKMVVKKYDPVARKHVEYKEGKIKQGSNLSYLITTLKNLVSIPHKLKKKHEHIQEVQVKR